MMKLFIVPTPIGNLEDITLRALRVLKEADFVLCEDTRTTKNLLRHYEIEKNCLAYHIHNEHQQLANMIRQIQQSETVALTSDAGTPGISDPGFLLVRECIKENIPVECLPGATALIPALVNSGLPSDCFKFYGFIPHKKGKETLLKQMAVAHETSIFYESPYRLLKTLEMMRPIFGNDRPIAISRELSKMFEENFRGTIEEAVAHFAAKPVKGEIVVIVGEKTDE
ncbi:MAG TPA: 16S rRNA (cytidine(1402)-2'-O)-methyltransferase [Bacteroidales bacterium]|nr:16S rRNA (cytidine(1402)-2'-O)-methyltransferase [Bacteroidales bacterium]HPT51987.1 16S rRNA (cytidine(1402)-2'-O)-methyltransferase [Bacteroidales bacterium]